MSEMFLFQEGSHCNVLLADVSGTGMAVQANHHVIVHGSSAIVLDPGGHKAFTKVFGELSSLPSAPEVKYLFLSHQDPDIVAAINGWMMVTNAQALVSDLWTRFVPHFGIDEVLDARLLGIPDAGLWLDLEGSPLCLLPAHFMHSAGNFHLYDPTSRILYSGDLGASLDMDYREVTNFDAHVAYMDGFHRRYMASNDVLRKWTAMVRTLDVEVIAPQHGALFRGRAMVNRFLDWIDTLQCGLDVVTFAVPSKSLTL